MIGDEPTKEDVIARVDDFVGDVRAHDRELLDLRRRVDTLEQAVCKMLTDLGLVR